MGHERVLLVDDEADFTRVLSQRIEARGVDVDAVTSGREALEKVKDTSYDAIILDLSMPEMDGMETMKHLLEGNPDLQVILLTGYASFEKGTEAIKRGAMDFLKKPTDIRDLMGKIEEAQANRMLLVEKRMEEKIKSILESKSW